MEESLDVEIDESAVEANVLHEVEPVVLEVEIQGLSQIELAAQALEVDRECEDSYSHEDEPVAGCSGYRPTQSAHELVSKLFKIIFCKFK